MLIHSNQRFLKVNMFQFGQVFLEKMIKKNKTWPKKHLSKFLTIKYRHTGYTTSKSQFLNMKTGKICETRKQLLEK